MSTSFNGGSFNRSVLPEGTYEAEFRDVRREKNVETRNGKRDRIVLDFIIEGQLIVEKCNVSKSSTCKLARFIEGMFGEIPDGDFDFKDLIGEYFQVEIKHNKDNNGRIWANIVEISRI